MAYRGEERERRKRSIAMSCCVEDIGHKGSGNARVATTHTCKRQFEVDHLFIYFIIYIYLVVSKFFNEKKIRNLFLRGKLEIVGGR